ncbi:PREDICTED: protein SSX1-like [Dipodomys ordii]|uniref:Protein SSX1-like n=1 Tax=Dipodomys ordii TaxID=10020 RepID=A0A1S3GV82_DIPOR|nr:PREDICTED: protein SSX1-like [Dipodomys ordii]
MNSDGSFSKIPREDSQNSPEKYQAFEDISKYFSKDEWEKLSYSQKISYVYMKRNYTTMSSLGFSATLPPFMEPKEMAEESLGTDSDEGCSHDNMEKHSGKQLTKRPKMDKQSAKKSSIQKGRSRAVDSTLVAVKNMCTPEKESASGKCSEKTSGSWRKKKNIWTHRLRERKNLVVYEEISDPEEEDDEDGKEECNGEESDEEEKEKCNGKEKEESDDEGKYNGGEAEKTSEDHSGEEYNEEEDYNEEDEYNGEESDEDYFIGEYEDNDNFNGLNVTSSSQGKMEEEMLFMYNQQDLLSLCVRLAVLLAVTLIVPIVLFPGVLHNTSECGIQFPESCRKGKG